MSERLPIGKKAISPDSYVKIGMQVEPTIYKMFKMASAKENRSNRELLNDALSEYVKNNHPDIFNMKFE